jgi:GNAT superfamily N-acetyltransferase
MKAKAPKNYRLQVIEYPEPDRVSSWLVKLSYKGEWCGYVDLCFDKRPPPFESFYETHCSLDEEHRHLGLGTLMYRKAFEVGRKAGVPVKSSLVPSDNAIRLWESKNLNSLWEIEKRDDRYCVLGERCNTRDV